MYHTLHVHDRFDAHRVSAVDPSQGHRVVDQYNERIIYKGDQGAAEAIAALLNTGSTRSEQRTFTALLAGMSQEIQQAVNAYMVDLFFAARSNSESDARMAAILEADQQAASTAQV